MSYTIHPRTKARHNRQRQILTVLQESPGGRVKISALRTAMGLDKTPWTLGRDLTDLEAAGYVLHVHADDARKGPVPLYVELVER